MDIFEMIGEKITKTGEKAMQKTKDTADLVKLNSQISDEERKLKELFYQVGKRCFKENFDNPESTFNQLFNEIKESQNIINACTEQVKKLKGIFKCPKCKYDVPNNAAFCSSCGSDIYIAPTSAARNGPSCHNCDADILAGKAFCVQCGTKVLHNNEEIL